MLSTLAHQLDQDQVLDTVTIARIKRDAQAQQNSFFEQIIIDNDIDNLDILPSIAKLAKMPSVDITRIPLDDLPLNTLPVQTLKTQQILPLQKRQNRLTVAMGDPNNNEALSQAKFHTKLAIIPVVCDPLVLKTLINQIGDEDDGIDSMDDDLNADINLSDMELETQNTPTNEDIVDLDLNNPIVQYVNKILRNAIKQGASDIHLEPYEKTARIRYRVDGILIPAGDPPLKLVQNIASRIKVLAKLDIAERRLPQDGRIKIRFSRTRMIDLRVSTMPTIFGEKIVLRILDQSADNLKLDQLGMRASQLAQYQYATAQPHGMILVTGPTGSGKTVSLYSALSILNRPNTNISSVEDPVEIYAEGVNQVSINEKAGLTFARTLRAFLRQDPDILMVGEIRDFETADIAIKASQTGHLVLSTLHTNDAPSAITRLINMGIPPFNIASTVNLVIAQRLVRRLCPSCREPVKLPTPLLLDLGFTPQEIKQATIFEPNGCHACTQGYRGRTGIFDVMTVSKDISELILNNGTEAQIRDQAFKDGSAGLKKECLDKVAIGITSLAEMDRVTKG